MDGHNFNSKLETSLNNQKNSSSPSSSKIDFKKPILIAVIIFLLVMGAGGYLIWKNLNEGNSNEPAIVNDIPKSVKEAVEKIYKPADAFSSNFALYEEIPVSASPKVLPYSIDKDLSNITNKNDFTFSEAAKKMLEKNSFVVIPASNEEFYPIYETNRYRQLPSFITADSMLHNYHLMFDYSLKKLEEENLIPELKKLNAIMLAESLAQYDALKGTEWENAAKRNIGFFAVGGKLLDPGLEAPSIVKNNVDNELILIEAHSGIDVSPVMSIGSAQDQSASTSGDQQVLEGLLEDYSQYVPRGHYNKTEDLKAYFKSMMWYGRLTFRLKNEDEVRSALLITTVINTGSNQKSWDKIYEPINFFVGKSDDITYYQFKDLSRQIYGQNESLNTIVTDKNKFASFTALARALEPPQINSMPIFQASIQPDREKEIKGFRFMGQRFTVDASIFQRLISREVGPKDKSCADAPFDGGRMLPKGLDIPAAMNSGEALNILTAQGETQFACYTENMSAIKKYISELKTDIWTQNLYWGWLYSLLPLTAEKPEGYPTFMRNSAWTRKELNTYLGSWTELKRDTILYTKQAYAEMGGGGAEEKDYRGYVEPNPYIYARLSSLLKMTEEGLAVRGILSEKNKTNFDKMNQLALSLKTISEKELNNEKLTEEEYNLIVSYGGQLEHFWFEAYSENNDRIVLDENTNAPVIADVATDPNGIVLEEGTGYVSEIYAIVPIDGKLRIAKGGVYSYYEFTQPLSDRLTDESWKEILKSGKAPQLPEWTEAFTAK